MDTLQVITQSNELENISTQSLIYYRQHPEQLPENLKQFIAGFQIVIDQSNRNIATADKAELKANYSDWKNLFLETRKSEKTRKAYKDAIAKLESFCISENIEPTDLNAFYADKYLQSAFYRIGKTGSERSDNSKKLDLAGISAFYTKLYRYSESKITNPFLGIDRPAPTEKKHIKDIPTKREVETILNETDGIIKASIYTMANRGLRIGALKNLHLTTRGNQTTFETFTKGKEQSGIFSSDIVSVIHSCKLPKIEPFADIDTMTLTKRIERKLTELYTAGKIKNRYSCHSFRHYFAVTNYKKNKDIEELRKLLNHSDINTTQIYLQSLGLMTK